MTHKQIPPIADRTLTFIAASAGGTVEANENQVRLTIGRHTIEADTNTQLIIKVLALLKNL